MEWLCRLEIIEHAVDNTFGLVFDQAAHAMSISTILDDAEYDALHILRAFLGLMSKR